DDGGATFVRGAAVAEAPLPPRPGDLRGVPPETIAAIAAAGRTVAFFHDEQLAVSRDGGAALAPVALDAHVRSLAVSRRGTLVAGARMTPPPERGPIAIVRVEPDPTGRATWRVTRVPLEPTDTCAPGRVFALADGSIVLGGERSFFGLCARVSRDEGRTFA